MSLYIGCAAELTRPAYRVRSPGAAAAGELTVILADVMLSTGMLIGDDMDITLLAYVDRLQQSLELNERNESQRLLNIDLVSQRDSRQRRGEAGVLGVVIPSMVLS
jgi:hypothetical protein